MAARSFAPGTRVYPNQLLGENQSSEEEPTQAMDSANAAGAMAEDNASARRLVDARKKNCRTGLKPEPAFDASSRQKPPVINFPSSAHHFAC
ncbi:hypothetical protein D3C86_991050 [compost metagenome]